MYWAKSASYHCLVGDYYCCVFTCCLQARQAAAAAAGAVHRVDDVDELLREVEQMSVDSLSSVDMTSEITTAPAGISTAVPGYRFTRDPGLLDGNLMQGPALQDLSIFDESFAADAGTDSEFDADSLLAAATDAAAMWAQTNAPATIDVRQFEDLMVFHIPEAQT